MWRLVALGLCLSAIAFAQDGCEYNGMMYKTGESFMDSDGCNTCFCSNGAIACTLKFCLPTSGIGTCSYDGQTYHVGDTFKDTAGCNTCTCQKGGMVSCTEMACVTTEVTPIV